MLDLHDFPGQGTALVGLLNAFWESKGIIRPEEFKRFCGSVVPLLRFEKATYANNEQFKATAELANFSRSDLIVRPEWEVTDINNRVLFKGKLKSQNVPIGNGNVLGEFNIDLNTITSAEQLNVILTLAGTNYKNQWKIWVYPQKLPENPSNVVFTNSISEAIKLVNSGKRVILNPDTSLIKGVNGRFAPVFWSPVHFPDQPGTMGLLINPLHAALANFPTAAYSDWQWWDLVTNSKTMLIDALPAKIDPVLRVIDNFFKNRNLANILEFKIGTGKLIVCSIDLHTDLEDRLAARQLKFSLLQYAKSEKFDPLDRLDESDLKKLFKKLN